MSSTDPTFPSSTTDESAAQVASSTSASDALAVVDDLDLMDVPLGERQTDACSMEEGCERCQ